MNFSSNITKNLLSMTRKRFLRDCKMKPKKIMGRTLKSQIRSRFRGVKFGYAINLSKCNGNGKCMEACNKENNHHRGVDQSYIRVLEMTKGSMDMEQGNTTYDHAVPQDDKFLYAGSMSAMWTIHHALRYARLKQPGRKDDGIVVVDYNWCIGCRYCEAACPYHARRFNWEQPEIPAEDVNPDQGYLSNRVRPQGVMEKCPLLFASNSRRSRAGLS